jgi:transcriptional regulator with XRE-family HTH domain
MMTEELPDTERWPVKRTLKAARHHAGLTQQQLAALANLTTTTIWDLENHRNKHPSYEKVAMIVEALRRCAGLERLTAEDLFPLKKRRAR